MIPKFRAWSKVNIESPEMREVRGINWHGDGVWFNDIFDDDTPADWAYFDDIILMQSTGLFDKNGVEIFEGDFLKNKDKPDTILICKKSDVQASFRACSTNGMISLALWHDESRDWTVIGNIHEHPHLVEVAYD